MVDHKAQHNHTAEPHAQLGTLGPLELLVALRTSRHRPRRQGDRGVNVGAA